MFAKMLSGVLARQGVWPWCRGGVAIAVIWGTWELGAWMSGFVHETPDGPGMLAVVIGIAQVATSVAILACSRLNLREATARAPFVCWCEMTDCGRRIAVWMLPVALFIIPAEAVTCAILALSWVCVGAGKILGARLR